MLSKTLVFSKTSNMAQRNFRQGTPVKTLELAYSSIEYYEPEEGGEYYLLINGSQPDYPLRLFQAAMDKLVEALPKAMEVAKSMDKTDLSNSEQRHICQVLQYGLSKARLYVNMYEQRAIVWLRLFSGRPNGPVLPTKCGVRFHLEDNIESIIDFAKKE